MVPVAPIAIDGSGSEALLAGAVARDPARPAVCGVTADLILADSALAGVRLLAALPGTSLHWRLDAETAYRENGGLPGNPVMVTAAGFVDGSAWQAHGGLAGLGPHGFAQGGMSDGMYPGPLLEVLTEQAVTGGPRFAPAAARHPASRAAAAADSVAAGAGPLAGIPGVPGADGVRRLTDDELLGTMSAAQRLRNRAEWLELSALAEFARRRHAGQEASIARGDPAGQRSGEFACEEIAFQTVCSGRAADERMDLAAALAARLPATCARMADGAVGSYRALITHRATRDLSAENAAIADTILAAEAPFLTSGALRRRAARGAMTLDPGAAAKRKKNGARHKRVEMWAEESGNAALAGREMDPADALAATAYYDALARALRQGGIPGTLRELRHLAYTDRNTGKDPLDRITGGDDGPGPDAPGAGTGPAHDTTLREPGEREQGEPGRPRDDGYREDEPAGYGPWDGSDDSDDESDDSSRGGSGNGGGPGPADPAGTGTPADVTAPVPANITVLVPAGTLLGWSSAPGEASRLGPLDPQATRDLIQAASRHPSTRWCVTLTGADGTAAGRGCAPGRHSWTPPGTSATGAGSRAGPAPPRAENTRTPEDRAAQIAGLLDWLAVIPEPIARGSCDHRHTEDRYTPSRKLAHLIRARTATCPAPACEARAEYDDLDHTVPWPEGPTDECNLAPPCRHHHRVKQAPGWKLEQPEPGVMRWTTPSGRIHTTRPTSYPTGDGTLPNGI